ncbi:hypothetical protein JW906_08335 [bacterium]|nr:hypothetical protein [bacterium]
MKTWKIDYKGHTIEVCNSLFREKLTVDGEIQDERSGFKSKSCLKGRIKSGDGAGETIQAELKGFRAVGCLVLIQDVEVFRS